MVVVARLDGHEIVGGGRPLRLVEAKRLALEHSPGIRREKTWQLYRSTDPYDAHGRFCVANAFESGAEREQEAFFLHGVTHLRPLTLARVAEAIGMHESTVSRVTSNKYLSCARGLFELKFFFTSGIAAADGGDAVSAEAVKSAIKTLIANEGAKILSDDTLVELLQAKGFDIARRTVAKYRESMGIGSSVQRRRARTLNG